jgi:tripartite-type tricarboxylate transporter receptor subunit TctC
MRISRTLISAFAATLAIAATAQAFPERPVNYIIPFNPGGESDISARLQQPFFEKITGHEAVIQYQPGAGGSQAWSTLNTLPADGHTIMGTNVPHIVMQPMLQNPGYETDDLVNVYMFHYTPDALIVRADSDFQTVQDVIDAAMEAPGAITVSGSGTNSANDVANKVFENETGAVLTYIPYSGTSPSVAALLGGEVEAQWGYSTVAAAQGDQVRMLAVAMENRHPLFPDVPTFKELGIDMVGGAYRGIAVPSGVDEETRQALSDIIGAINADPAFIEAMEGAGFAMLDVSYDEMADWMAARKDAYRGIADQLAAGR